MRSFSRLLLGGAALMTALGLSGCFSRQMVNFQTHPEKDTLLMETYETRDYLVWSKHEHVYWSCTETGSSLQCTRRCGAKTDLVCPAASIFANSASTNYR
jgi:hypothetical protein